MSRNKSTSATFLAPLAIAVLAASCVDADSSIQILQNNVPEEGCIVPSDDDATFLPRGQIDVEAGSGYLFTPVVQNVAQQSDLAQRTAYIDGANVDLKFAGDYYSDAELATLKDEGLSFFRQPFSGTIAAGGTASFAFEIIPKGMLDSIAGKIGEGETMQVTAEIQLVGSLNGGGAESQLFKYPVQVCKGCLQNNLGTCSAVDNGNVRTGGVCQPLQDGVVDCCDDAGNWVCPAFNPEA